MPILVTKRPLPRHHRLSDADLTLKPTVLSARHTRLYRAAADVAGLRTRQPVRAGAVLTPTMVERVATGDGPPTASQGQPERVPADMLRVGDQISVKPGQLIPVDGEVVWGASDVNQAPLTGESQPIAREVGDEVFAGTWNGESPLRIRMTRPQSESVAARIGQIVQRAHASRAPIERFIDRFARRYTPAVMALAMVVAIVPPLVAPASTTQLELASFTPWIHRGLILLVIACPCALVISTPVTIVCGLARAAKKGILIQGGQFLETAAGLDALALDKTGTITRGKPSVTAVHVASGQKFVDVLRVAASLEAHSSHPFALAIVDYAAERQIAPTPATDVSARTGSGLLGHVDGAACAVGSARLIKSLIGDQQPAEIATDDDHGCSRVYVLRDGELLGHILLTDPPRDDAASTLAVLNQMGVRRFVLLTGDRRTAADRLSQELQKADKQFPRAWEVQAELLPEDKAAFVRRLAEDGSCVGMVGDGINDAPALASADIGIALGSDVSDAALEVADVSILTENLGKLVDLVRLARRCLQLLRQNITFALAAKALVAVLAALGWASMGAAVLADVGASLVVVANGMRMLRA